MTAFDVILGIMLGSILSRTINGPSPLLPTMTAALLLVLLHRAIGMLAYRSPWFSFLVKGRTVVLVDHGRPIPEALRKLHISEEDLLQGLRSEGGINDLGDGVKVMLERSGKISVVSRS